MLTSKADQGAREGEPGELPARLHRAPPFVQYNALGDGPEVCFPRTRQGQASTPPEFVYAAPDKYRNHL